MGSLVDVIEDDLSSAGRISASFGKGFLNGILHGIYTPFLIGRGVRYHWENFGNILSTSWNHQGKELANHMGVIFGQPMTVGLLTAYAFKHDFGKEYIAAAILTNLADYLVHAYQRAHPSSTSDGEHPV